jgi:hypothetical protein
VDRGFAQLQLEASAFKRASFAESTKATYRSHRNCYLRYCLYFSLCPVPATQLTLKTYVSFLARSIKPSGINGYLNIIRIMHLEAGYDNPLEANFELSMIKRGVERQLGSPPVQKLPIDVEILRRLSGVLDLTETGDICFWAAVLLGFYGMLRKSSLLLKNSRVAADSGLCRYDVVNVTVDSFVLVVRQSKTNQFGRRVHQIPFVSCEDTVVCPVRAILRHLVASKSSGVVNLFAYVRDGRSFVLCHAEFVSKLRKCLAMIGLDPSLYSAHSL